MTIEKKTEKSITDVTGFILWMLLICFVVGLVGALGSLLLAFTYDFISLVTCRSLSVQDISLITAYIYIPYLAFRKSKEISIDKHLKDEADIDEVLSSKKVAAIAITSFLAVLMSLYIGFHLGSELYPIVKSLLLNL